jgi:hypothetical protein
MGSALQIHEGLEELQGMRVQDLYQQGTARLLRQKKVDMRRKRQIWEQVSRQKVKVVLRQWHTLSSNKKQAPATCCTVEGLLKHDAK